MAKANPFIPPGQDYGAVDTESRLRALEAFNLEQCHAALEVLGLQATVEKKLRIRIRALERLPAIDGGSSMAQPSATPELAAVRTLEALGYTYHGAEQWKPPMGKAPEYITGKALELERLEVVAFLLWPLKGSMAGQRFTGLGDIPSDANRERFGYEPLMTVSQHDRILRKATVADAGQVPSVCDGKEQDAFEAWAASQKMDMSCHPLHWLFLNEKTYSARQGWKAALEYVGSQIAAAPAQGGQ